MTFILNAQAKWSQEESDLAARFRAEGLSNAEIGTRLDRSEKSIRQHLYKREHPEKAAGYKKTIIDRRQVIRTSRVLDMENAVASRPSAEMIEDRFRRSMLPARDLTAILLGDPPVGLSALDRRA